MLRVRGRLYLLNAYLCDALTGFLGLNRTHVDRPNDAEDADEGSEIDIEEKFLTLDDVPEGNFFSKLSQILTNDLSISSLAE